MAYGGLTDRLGQHTQRTGALVGCSMALALLVCIATGLVLYQRLDQYRTDVFGIPTVVQSVPTVPPSGTARATRVAATSTPPAAAAPAEQPPPATPEPAEATPPPTVRYRVVRTGGENLNMRSNASTQSPIVARLPPNAVVEDAGEQANAPAGGQTVVWRKVKGPGGQVGWVPETYLEKVEE